MAIKTIAISDGINPDEFYQIPCDEDVNTDDLITTIPNTWIPITRELHEASIAPCQTSVILRIFCPQ